MKFSFNVIVQGLATAAQVFNAVSPLIDPDQRAKIAGIIAAAQAVTAAIAHFRNPDGTPAVMPYRPSDFKK
jgi:hypothetical protein